MTLIEWQRHLEDALKGQTANLTFEELAQCLVAVLEELRTVQADKLLKENPR